MAASSSVIPSPDILPVESSEAGGRGRTWSPAELLALLLAWDSMEKDHPQTKLKELEVPLRNKFTFAMEIIAEVFGPKSFVLTATVMNSLKLHFSSGEWQQFRSSSKSTFVLMKF